MVKNGHLESNNVRQNNKCRSGNKHYQKTLLMMQKINKLIKYLFDKNFLY
jgi:hypothetical protein